ncbi:MAG: flagellar basal body rod protein FlgB [Rhodocyclaceae bacterium]|jgi:flagellar basal-body rod protein FlgB|nr:flagellar basal body rod protein FlgB [Rhodocyclaceae bacterium]MCE2723797.1 flagellar basal body rod protein FlgB [Betaproteobacteria bacterium]MCA3019928.1 flagellar basal body rod protein FlgB [Rhodocyclaceae bacterium]MCA3021782.1 flagellar basal body rod protein FlgB [Rhodocyclaceae bacterium]MCA3026713.1 flagellar basal body rod protein FlgB [Rhodocyclaceae bacterium]
MLNRITSQFDFNADALKLRSERQRVIASNIANADTPGFQARDFNFREALSNVRRETTTSVSAFSADSTGSLAITNPRHLSNTTLSTSSFVGKGTQLKYSMPIQGAFDGNTVDVHRETANFAENAVRYEAALRFLNGQIKTMGMAVNGQ